MFEQAIPHTSASAIAGADARILGALAAVVAEIPDAIFILDPEGRCLELNPAAQFLVGDDVAAIGKPLADVWPGDPSPVREPADPSHARREITLLRGGAEHLFEVHLSATADPRGQVVSRIVRLHEATDAERLERALRFGEESYQAALAIAANLQDGVALVDRGQVIFANERACEIFGRSQEELGLDQIMSMVAPQDRERLGQTMRQVSHDPNAARDLEFWIIRPDGSRRYVRSQYTNLPGTELGSGLIVTTDLTERKLAEDNLRDREERLRLMVEHMPAILWSTDDQLRVTSALGQGFAALDADPAGVVDRLLAGDRSAGPAAPSVAAMHRRALEGASLTFEMAWLDAWLQIRLEPLRNQAGTISGTIGLAVDITERREMEEAEYEQRVLAQALRASAAALNTTLDVDQVLDRILDNVGRVVPHDAACVMLVEKDRAHIVRHRGYSQYGVTDQAMMDLSLPLDRPGNLRDLVEGHQALAVPDTHSAPDWTDIPEMRWQRSVLAAPILNDGNVVGILALGSAKPSFYMPADATRLQAFADQAAVALKNARLLAESEQRAERLGLVYEAGLALNRILDPRTQLEILFKITAQALHVDHVAFFRFDAVRKEMRFEVSIGDPPEVQAMLRRFAFSVDDEGGFAGRVTRERRPLNVPDVHADSRLGPIQENLVSGLWVPVEQEGHLLGILSALSERHGAFGAEDERLLMLFAHQAAVALENGRHFQETQQRAQRQAMLYHLSTGLAHVQETQLLCETVVRELGDTIGYQNSEIFLLDPETGDRVLEARLGTADAAVNRRLRSGEGLTEKAASTGELQYWSDVTRESLYVAGLPGGHSELDIPIKIGTTVLGVLVVEDARVDAFAAGDFDLLQAVANQLAVALENTRLFEEISRRAEELQVLNTAALKITQHSDSDEIIRTACNELQRFGTFASVFLMAGGELELAHAAMSAEMQSDFVASFGDSPMSFSILADRFAEVWSKLQAGRTLVEANLLAQIAGAATPASRPVAEWLQARARPASLLVAPLMRQEAAAEQKTIGLIAIAGSRLGAPEISAISLVARHLSVALENARLLHEAEQRARVFAALFETSRDLATENSRLLEETDQRARVFAALFEISRDLATRHDRSALLQNIVQCTAALLGAHGAAIYLFDPARHDLEMAVSEGAPAFPAGLRLRLGEDVAGQVAQTLQPLVVDEYDVWEYRSPQYAGHALSQVMGIPMLWAGELIGVLAVYGQGTAGRRFTEADEHLLTLFAGPAANVVRNASLVAETEHRIRELSALNRIGISINSTLELERVLELTMQEIQDLFRVEVCSLMLLDEASQELVLQISRGLSPEQAGPIRLRLDQGIAGLVAREGEALLVPDVHSDPRWYPGVDLRTGFTTRSIIAIPLTNKGRMVGVMEVINKTEGVFTKDDLQMLESISMVVTAAIENARLFGELNKAYQELAQTSRQIMESRNTLRALFDGITDSICILDQDYHIIAINQSAATAAGQPPPALVGDKCYAVFCQRDEPCPECPIPQTIQSGQPCQRTTSRLGPRGTNRDLELRTFPLENANGVVDRIIYITSDVTEKRQMELSLIQSAKLSAVGELAAGVAHEIRNPLTAVIGNAQMLQRSLPPETPHHEMARLIEHASLRAERVVSNLLNFSRREQYVFGPTDVNATIEDAYSLIAYAMERSKIKVVKKLAPKLPMIVASPSHLQTVWTNLLLNARDAIQGHRGQIRIETRFDKREGNVKVTFKDNGQGIPEKDVERIFEPFFTTKGPNKGTGLGLYITYTVIAQHHGVIGVQSQVGKGTTFTVTLPLEGQGRSGDGGAES